MTELAKLRALTSWLDYANVIASALAVWDAHKDRPFTAAMTLLSCEKQIGAALVGMTLDQTIVGVRSTS